MRSHAQRSLALLPDDTKRFVLLIAGAWIAGLAIVLLLGLAWPATSPRHGADRASPSSDVSVTTAGYRLFAPAPARDAASHGSADRTGAPAVAPPVGLAGHRWVPAAAPPVELAGHRWLPAVSATVELAGHRWSSTAATPVEFAGHRWVPAVAAPEAMTAPSQA